jgi:hypothetical protein
VHRAIRAVQRQYFDPPLEGARGVGEPPHSDLKKRSPSI